MAGSVQLSELWPLSLGVRDIMMLESFSYHRTRIGAHPEPCLMCLSQSSVGGTIELSSGSWDTRGIQSSKRWWLTDLLYWLAGKLTRS